MTERINYRVNVCGNYINLTALYARDIKHKRKDKSNRLCSMSFA